ncbi:RNA polymerase-binding protein RbpA [Streptomyces sp. BE20]|uniref:RNA polymerase-binding protein RbpA n=1 Tax=Streptomycetaceae TaxID=2062 RepID=UPI002E77984E|nr:MULTISPECIES: RNA polymerase-binding protein RbpA [unclassified Streptomyces]MED7948551.1 RNA polymerase-binding protein RbpA [Streptomyces sp. BE303]MEE1828498.1 RNA polymerase-binding protein RbpA [Streptomyces sp. BE20]
MAQGHGGLRGARIGSGPMGESERGDLAPRVAVSFWCGNGHHSRPRFAVGVEAPELWDCRRCGLPAGTDPDNTPEAPGSTPFKTHFAYVLQRRTREDGEILLNEALAKLRGTF